MFSGILYQTAKRNRDKNGRLSRNGHHYKKTTDINLELKSSISFYTVTPEWRLAALKIINQKADIQAVSRAIAIRVGRG